MLPKLQIPSSKKRSVLELNCDVTSRGRSATRTIKRNTLTETCLAHRRFHFKKHVFLGFCRECVQAPNNATRQRQPETDEAASRVEFDSAELEREEDQTLSTSSLNVFDDGSESSTATLCFTKAFSEQMAFVEVHGHNVVMLHADQELVLVQLSKTVQSRRFERTSVRHGPRIQSKIENLNQVINGVCWSMWLTLEIFCEKNCQMTAFCWPGRFSALRGA